MHLLLFGYWQIIKFNLSSLRSPHTTVLFSSVENKKFGLCDGLVPAQWWFGLGHLVTDTKKKNRHKGTGDKKFVSRGPTFSWTGELLKI